EVVRAVDDDVVAPEDRVDVLGVEPQRVLGNLDLAVALEDPVASGGHLGAPDVGLGMDDLALQVGLVDSVEVDDPELPDASGREVVQHGRAEASSADDAHPRIAQAALTELAEL